MALVFFNELSVYPLCLNINEARTRLSEYADILLKMKSNIPNVEIRYQYRLHYTNIIEGFSIGQICLFLTNEARKNHNGFDVNKFQYLLMSQHDPYIKEDELPESERNDYQSINVFLNKNTDNSPKAEGFKAAYFCQSICVGFNSEPLWKNHIHSIIIEDDTGTRKTDTAICVSKGNHLYTPEYVEWINKNAKIELITSTIPTHKKLKGYSNAVGKHHGKDILYAHALKLIQSPYVDEIITSTAYGSPSEKDYIARIEADGIIRIMLVWENPKVSMLIKTTGRNLNETKAIADILRKQFAG